MKAIYASKMYRNSKNKAKIKAAIENPINKELVLQLREYLDEPEVVDIPDVDPVDADVTDTLDNSSTTSEGSLNSVPMSKPSAHSRVGQAELSDMFDVDDSSDDSTADVGTEPDDTDDTDDNSDDLEDTVEESTKAAGTSITSASCINCDNLLDVISEIKGLLNLRDDTCGVNRVLNKDNELWVYYKDSVNLNNVMGTVIELMNASGYTYLEFNRLARTDNAIVFQISILDSNNKVEPVRGVNDGK